MHKLWLLFILSLAANAQQPVVPGMQVGLGFSGGAVSATGTQTSELDVIQGEVAAEVVVIWSGVTGSPSGCTLQTQSTSDGSNFVSSGPALSLTPGTNQSLSMAGPLLLGIKYVYACNTYPGAGTIQLGIFYKNANRVPTYQGTIPEVTAAWTSSTASNTALLLTVQGYNTVSVYLNQGSTITGGVLTFEASDTTAFTNAYSVVCVNQNTTQQSSYTLLASTNVVWVCPVQGAVAFRVRLSTVISGTATVNVGLLAYVEALQPAVAAFQANSTAWAVTQSSGPWTINLTQIAGNAPATGNGTTSSTGDFRVNLASDNTAIANWGQGSTGSAVPSGAVYQGYIATTAYPTAASAGNLVGGMADKAGRPTVVLNTVRDLVGSTGVQSTSASAQTLIAAGASGVFDDIISLTCTNESNTATIITISDNGAGGNTYKFAVPGTEGTGFTVPFVTPLPQGTAAAAWDILNSAAVTLDCVVVYAKNK